MSELAGRFPPIHHQNNKNSFFERKSFQSPNAHTYSEETSVNPDPSTARPLHQRSETPSLVLISPPISIALWKAEFNDLQIYFFNNRTQLIYRKMTEMAGIERDGGKLTRWCTGCTQDSGIESRRRRPSLAVSSHRQI